MTNRTKESLVAEVESSGVIAILRATSSESFLSEILIAATSALLAGGVKLVEVTLTTPGALQTIKQARSKFDDQLFFGAGSVLTVDHARSAIEAGAQFLVTPVLDLEVIRFAVTEGIVVIPGCFTPTEMYMATSAGADFIKFFPAEIGGPSALKAILAPLPQLKIIPVGGVTLETTPDFFKAGAVAVGIGGKLVDERLLNSSNWEEIEKRAAQFISLVKEAKPVPLP